MEDIFPFIILYFFTFLLFYFSILPLSFACDVNAKKNSTKWDKDNALRNCKSEWVGGSKRREEI